MGDYLKYAYGQINIESLQEELSIWNKFKKFLSNLFKKL